MSKIKDFFIELFSFSKIGALFLFLLVSVDFIFIVLHCLNIYGLIDRNDLYYIEDDNSYSEVFQYIKEFWIFIILFHVFIKKKRLTYLIWSLLFLYVLLDDSLTIHETLGEYLANYFEIKPRFNLRAVDFGELMVSFIAGITFLMFFILGYNKAKIKDKIVSQHLFVLFIILVFFGVFVDMIHIYFESNHKLGLIEDGGEMLTISLITSYVFNLTKSDSQI